MTGFETGLTGGLGLLIVIIAALAVILYLVPRPPWTSPLRGC
ncbi:MAG: hypothetical protein ACREU4_02925 [Burkholderiales bacterium]